MRNETLSIVLGTTGLTLAAIVALALTCSRQKVAPESIVRIRWRGSLAVILQVGHFCEEYIHQFYQSFPAMLGLSPWSKGFFVTFNLVWLFVWAMALAGIAKFPRAAVFPLWFLAIASALNGIIHPLLAVVVTGYFPGLWSSPFVGVIGVLLFRELVSATRQEAKPGAG